jgi:predicted transcriptional regulator
MRLVNYPNGGDMADLKRFFELNSVREKVSSAELIAFKRSCVDEAEYEAYVNAAKAAMAVPA